MDGGTIPSFLAHELKAALATAMMNLAALVDKQISERITEERRTEMLLAALASLKIMEDMVRNYLTSSKIRREEMRLNKTAVEVERDVLEPVLSELEPLLLKRRMTVVKEVSPSSEILCDKGLMRIVLNNLINNAAKYGAKGTQIHLSLSQSATDFQFSILNEGMGVRQEKLEDVFGEYTKYGPPGIPGTGLGLWVVKRIAELHRGSVLAQSGYIVAGNPTTYESFEGSRNKQASGKDQPLRRFARFILKIPKS